MCVHRTSPLAGVPSTEELMMQHLGTPNVLALDLKNKKIRNVSNQNVLPRLENVAKSQSNVAIEGHFMLLRVIQLLPKAEFHLNVATSHR